MRSKGEREKEKEEGRREKVRNEGWLQLVGSPTTSPAKM